MRLARAWLCADAMLTVLVVDDEPPIVELVRFTLEDERLRVLEAGDGVAALELARRERPDLILLDVQMPRLGGLDVCRRVRQDPLLSGTRIVMLTAADQEADRARGLAAGADEYLSKPFSPLALFALVRTLLPGVCSWPET
jgi:DNA-binding response OmpR family regulator